ncbi:hypothetical protein QE400_004119 [Xanthomonas sacchari]|nr:hypothetical protein [Xanthomonas sacchari]MDQ1094706.1 hypothetical protein [Xanthomonas sacchari]
MAKVGSAAMSRLAPVARPPHQIAAVALQPVQGLADLRRIAPAVRQQPHAIADALEQDHAEETFQAADLAADGAFGQDQFLGRARETAMPGRRLERHERGMAGDLAAHIGSGSRRRTLPVRA